MPAFSPIFSPTSADLYFVVYLTVAVYDYACFALTLALTANTLRAVLMLEDPLCSK